MVAPAGLLFEMLDKVGNANAKGEYYLTDVVGLARADGYSTRAAFASEEDVMGVNSQAELAEAEAIFQRRTRAQMMAGGVSMTAPETVFFSADTEIEDGVRIEPNVVFGPKVRVERGALIRAFSHLEGCVVHAGAQVGPFARLRPGADIGVDAHIGNFVEVKNVKVGAGAKANHLTYLGDGEIGAKANIGAGTIFCNYDGFEKARTVVGAGAFVGSNSSLVAPVTIGDGAYVGSGSVVTKDVAPDALVIERNSQVEKPGWAARFRETKHAKKAKT
jgi:bifunctional UDP-N-acetylglucosamine pyrophosphorylase/glucosamine-1-phosphate N-acetyltransferase